MSKSKFINRHSESKVFKNKTKGHCLMICQTGVLFWVTWYLNIDDCVTCNKIYFLAQVELVAKKAIPLQCAE